uniref:Uncharacterized protein n=1 Tax=Tetradesmus obliquus TaxID=3088 RepID=A0A383V850_TETOB
MASANSGRRPGDVDSPLSSATESAQQGVTSHPVDDISVTPGTMTPASGLSQNGSPTSEDSSRYSPLSQPYGERPLARTSAGAAVQQSISNLPSPPPFTPEHTSGFSMASPETVQQQPAGTAAAAAAVSPVPFSPDGGMSAAASCGSSGPAAGADTPGVSSGWGFGSSTKPSASEGFAFARHPAAATDGGSPDVQPFAGNVAPGANAPAASADPSPLLLQAARNMAASHEADTASERSSVSGASRSSSMRDSYHGPHGSPAMLLRKAKAMIDRQVAVGGTARLSRGSKGSRHSNALQTPADKGIPAATTPQNTPLDVEAEHCGDQQPLPTSPVIVAPVIAVGSPISSTPASVSFAGRGSPAAAAAAAAAATTLGAAERVTTPVQLASPADSHTSVVSIGSVCTPASVLTAANVSARRLDFTEAAGEMEAAAGSTAATPAASPQRPQQQQQQGICSPGLTNDLLPASPLPIEELEAKMLSSEVKKFFAKEMPDIYVGDDGEINFDSIKFADNIDGAAVVEAFSLPDAEAAAAAAAPKRRGLLGKSGSTLLWLLAGVALVATSFVAVEMLPQTLAPPGCFCTENNLEACLKADQALNRELSNQPTGWRLAAKQAGWYLQDAADVLLRRRLPRGVTAEDFSRVWISSLSEEQWRSVPVEKAAALFAAVPQHLWPQAIVDKLQSPEGAAALLKQRQQAPPEDLVAASGAEAAAAADPAASATEDAAPADTTAAATDLPAAASPADQQPPAAQQAEGVPAAEEAVTPEPVVLQEPAIAEEQQPTATEQAAEPEPAPAQAQAAAEPAQDSAEPEQPVVVAETAPEQAAVPEATEASDTAAVEPAAVADEPVQQEAVAEPAVEQAVTEPEASECAPAATTQQDQQQQQAEAVVEAAPEELQQQQQKEEEVVEPAAPAAVAEPEAATLADTAADSQDAAATTDSDLQAPAALQKEEQPQELVSDAAVSTTEQQQKVQDAAPAVDAAAAEPVARATALQTATGAILAFISACAAMFFLPAIKGWLLGSQQEPEEEEQQDEAAGDEAAAEEEAAAAAAEEAEAAAAAAATAAEQEDPHAGLLSDEEEVPHRRRRSAAAAAKSPMQALLGGVGDVAGMAATILTPKGKPPLPPAAAAAAEAGAGPSAAAAAAAGGRTPRAARSAGAAAAATGGRRTTRSASGAAGAAAAGAESDGEEVASAGRSRRAAAATPRGRRASVLPAVLEDVQGAAEDPEAGLLSDEEAAAPAAARGRGRRQSAPAAGAAAAAAPAASGGRRRSAAAAAAAAASGGSEQPAVSGRATRRSSRLE